MVAQQVGRRSNGGNRADLRLHRHRRRIGRLRGRRAPVGIRPPSRAAAGSRAAGSQSVDPHPPRLRQDLCRSAGELEVRDASRSRSLATAALSAARQDAGRHQLDQRHGLYARQPRRLRRMAPARLRGLGLGLRPAVFPEGREPERGADEFHGVGGPLHVSDQPGRFELADAVLEACVQAGIPRNPDFNGAQQEGCGYYQTTTNNRRRWSTAQAYLGPARKRANLVIRTGAHATRVLIENSRAVGVEYHTPQGRETARARGEVIVSGGAYGSPQLLLLSGLGPAQHLQDMGIAVVRDMPAVGSNLHDHFNSYVAWRCSKRDHAERPGAQRCGKLVGRRALRAVPLRPDGGQRHPCRRSSRAATRGWSGPTSRSTSSNGARSSEARPASCRIRSRASRSVRCICAPTAAARCGWAVPIRWRRPRCCSTSCAPTTTCRR